MNLADFIRANMEPILSAWEEFARTRLPAASRMSKQTLRDHAEAILEAIAEDMETPQSDEERARRSKGWGQQRRLDLPGETHANLRVEEGFTVEQLVSEYRALRSSVISLWEQSLPELTDADRGDLTRFNEAVDQALTASLTRFTRKLNTYRDLFLAILGHDLRNPIGAVEMSGTVLVRSPDPAVSRAGSRILSCTTRMKRMLSDLLDLTRTRLGAGIPICPAPTDLVTVSRQVIDEIQMSNPERTVRFESRGRFHGTWDADRIAQVLSNLLSNAIQHGSESTPITLVLRDEGPDVAISVHNEGPAITQKEIGSIFEPLVRKPTGAADERASSSLGLGLFVVREIVNAHGGEIRVTSSKTRGTTFEVRLPRQPPRHERREPPATHAP